MVAFNHWAMFLQHINYGSEIRTLIARVSPNNILAIKLLLAAGFKSTFDSNEFKDELNEPKPSYVRFIQSMVNIEGKNYNVTIMTTPRRPDPKVIFLKRIPNLIKTIQSSAS
jgi:hypothetical protein